MNVEKRPKSLPRTQVEAQMIWRQLRKEDWLTKQALAAVGQCQLMSLWANQFSYLQQPVAQILLTRNDIADVSYHTRGQSELTTD